MIDTFLFIVEEHIGFKKQLFKLAKSDLVKTYRGAALGWSWAVIKPAITVFVFWFAFSIGLRAGKVVNGYPYFLWLISGFIPWFYMSEMITQGAGCIRKYSHLVTKMKFPISVIPTYVGISKMFVQLALIGIMIVIFCFFGFFPDIYYIQLILYIAMMMACFVVWALLSGMLSAISKDFQNLVNACVNAVFWLSGIMYDVNNIRHDAIRMILRFNPVTVIANGFRNTLIYKRWFFEEPIELLCFLVTFTILFVLAMITFKKLRKEIPDVL